MGGRYSLFYIALIEPILINNAASKQAHKNASVYHLNQSHMDK